MDKTTPLNPLTVPLQKVRIIEASAGTGKTYTIASLYLRLVLSHGQEGGGLGRPLMPPEILVVTFTRAATEELRDRIRNRLAEAADVFRGIRPPDPYLAGLRSDFAPSLWPARARLLEQAAQWMDEAAIHTIHAWCQRMLGQHAFETGSLFQVELEGGDDPFLETAVRDYWRTHLYPLAPEALEDLLALIKCKTPDELLVKVKPLLNRGELDPENPFERLAARRRAVEAARQVWAGDLAGAAEAVRKARADKRLNNNKYRAASVEKWLAQVDAWASRGGPLPEEKALEMLSAAGLAQGTAKGKTAPDHPAFDALDRLREALSALRVEPAFWAHCAAELVRKVAAQKEREAKIGFDDLVARLGRALDRDPDQRLARMIRRQFPAAFIDEFQDTDPVQYAIFKKIYLDAPETALLMIGDPKQAIYAFRGGDIHTYLLARKDAGGRSHSLGTNFRSARGLVAAVNRIFSQADAYDQGPFLFGRDIPFHEVDAHGTEAVFTIGGRAAAAMTFWHPGQAVPLSKTGPEGYREQMAAATAAEVARLLNLAEKSPPEAGFQAPGRPFRPLAPSDLAILVRDRNEARAVRRALERCRIPSVYLSDSDTVFDSPEAADLVAILTACAEPGQARGVRNALATAFVDLSLDELDWLNRSETAWEIQAERFRHYQEIWQRQGVLPMLHRFLADFKVAACSLCRPGGERKITNFLHLAELLQAAAMELDGEKALIRWLVREMERPASPGAEERILRLESDEALVRVVTVHKSKGLEYPLVFYPFAASFREVTRKSSPVRFHDDQGRLRTVMEPDEKDLERADRERLAEDLRLGYVALTRARHACWVGMGVTGSVTKAGEKNRFHRSAMGYLLTGGEPVLARDLADRLQTLAKGCPDIVLTVPSLGKEIYSPAMENARALDPAASFGGRVPADWWIASYSAVMTLAEGADRASADSAAEDRLQEAEIMGSGEGGEASGDVRTIHDFPRGAEPGTFLHGIFEWAAREGFHGLATDRERVRAQIAADCRRQGWLAWTDLLTDWFLGLLRTPFDLPGDGGRVRLSQLATTDCRAELEFLFAARRVDTRALDRQVKEAVVPGASRPGLRQTRVHGMLKGFIDLVFCFRGRYFVLDYKSNHLGPGQGAYGRKDLVRAMLGHRYDLQYVLYVLALHRLLKSRMADYRYQRDMGGAVYLFLRGVNGQGAGVYADKPPWSLIQRLDEAFAGREVRHDA